MEKITVVECINGCWMEKNDCLWMHGWRKKLMVVGWINGCWMEKKMIVYGCMAGGRKELLLDGYMAAG